MKTYRLASSNLVSAPGIVAWAINGYAFKRDRKQMVRVISETWGIPARVAAALLSKAVRHTIEGDTVVVTA